MSRKFGNAQTIGCNINQNTYFMTKQSGDGFLAVLADGTIDSVTGAYGAILACETVARGFQFEGDVKIHLEQQFSKAAALLNERMYKGRFPRISLLAACFLKGRIIYQSVGEMHVITWGGKGLTEAPPGQGQINAAGLTALLCNKGVLQALTEIDLERLLSERGHPYQKAQNLIETVNKKNLKDQTSAVAVIVR